MDGHLFFFNFLAFYIEYILLSEHYGHSLYYLQSIWTCFLFCLREIMPAVRKNKEQAKTNAAYNIVMGADMNEEEVIAANRRNADQMANVIDIR